MKRRGPRRRLDTPKAGPVRVIDTNTGEVHTEAALTVPERRELAKRNNVGRRLYRQAQREHKGFSTISAKLSTR